MKLLFGKSDENILQKSDERFLNIDENQTASYSDVCFIQIKAN